MTDTGTGPGPRFVEGRVERATSNALRMSFRAEAGEPLATARQNGAGGVGRKLGTLLGFKNGGTGTHELMIGSRILGVVSRDSKPTDVTDGIEGAALYRIERGETSSAVTAAGTPLLNFAAAEAGDTSPTDMHAMTVTTPDGERVGTVHIIRTQFGWSASDAFWGTGEFGMWWRGQVGQPLPLPFLGSRIVLDQPVDPNALDVLLAACVDIVIGLRPYTAAMR